MLRKIKSYLSRNEVELKKDDLINRVVAVRAHNDVLVLYGSPTEGNWLGIANATKSLFPDNAVEVPQYYSKPTFDTKQTQEICFAIMDLKFKRIVISGFAFYFFEWIDLLSKQTEVSVLFHGTISEFYSRDTQIIVENFVNRAMNGTIKDVGFVKSGLSDIFNKLYNIKTYQVAFPLPEIPNNIVRLELDKTKIHIGVFGANTFNKNLHNQVINALLYENTVVHVLEKSIFSYLNKNDRIVEHGKNLPRTTFLNILASMDLNLYMSFNESFGLVAYESEALGVPCVKSLDIDYFSVIKNSIEQSRK
ncbi:MAG: hypothetical protein U0T32_14050 [Chitinophagales bacterium]